MSLASKRFEAINKLVSKGIFAVVLLMPVLPFIEDSDDNILKIIKLAKDNGAKFIYADLRLHLDKIRESIFKTK